MQFLAQALMAQDNWEVLENPIVRISAYLNRVLLRMKPPEFRFSKVEANTNEFIDELYMTLCIRGLFSREKAELAEFQFKDVA